MSGKVVARKSVDFTSAEKMLREEGIQLVLGPMWTEEDVIRDAGDADAVIVGATDPYTSKVIQNLKKCRVISRMGIGFNNIDLEEATRQGIPVTVVLDASVHEVSDQAMAFLLEFSRKIAPLAQAVRQGKWVAGSAEIIRLRGQMFRLNTQTLGLVGVGRIGSRMPGKARAFGMRVLAYDPYLSAEELRQRGAEKVEFDRLLRESDFISIHAPLTAETRSMFGLEQFRKMKPTAVIINTARGAIINHQGLYQALAEGAISGAGLDVCQPEPLAQDDPLLKLEQVMITGHSAFFSQSSMLELQQRAAGSIITAMRGEWPSSVINPEVKKQKNRRIP